MLCTIGFDFRSNLGLGCLTAHASDTFAHSMLEKSAIKQRKYNCKIVVHVLLKGISKSIRIFVTKHILQLDVRTPKYFIVHLYRELQTLQSSRKSWTFVFSRFPRLRLESVGDAWYEPSHI